jgi:poly(A) polymerase
LRAALAGQPLADDLRPRLKAAAVARFPVKPADLMPGYQGPALGRRLAELERRWVASGFTLTRAALLAGPDDD